MKQERSLAWHRHKGVGLQPNKIWFPKVSSCPPPAGEGSLGIESLARRLRPRSKHDCLQPRSWNCDWCRVPGTLRSLEHYLIWLLPSALGSASLEVRITQCSCSSPVMWEEAVGVGGEGEGLNWGGCLRGRGLCSPACCLRWMRASCLLCTAPLSRTQAGTAVWCSNYRVWSGSSPLTCWVQ